MNLITVREHFLYCLEKKQDSAYILQKAFINVQYIRHSTSRSWYILSTALYTGRIHAMPHCCECGAPSELTLVLQRDP